MRINLADAHDKQFEALRDSVSLYLQVAMQQNDGNMKIESKIKYKHGLMYLCTIYICGYEAFVNELRELRALWL